MGSTSTDRSTAKRRRLVMQRRMNITLTAIVVCFFLLVFPSELLMFVLEVSEEQHDANIISHMTVSCQLLQAVNMSINFILYCVVNSHFRQTLKNMLPTCRGRTRRRRALSKDYSQSNAGKTRMSMDECAMTDITTMKVEQSVVADKVQPLL